MIIVIDALAVVSHANIRHCSTGTAIAEADANLCLAPASCHH